MYAFARVMRSKTLPDVGRDACVVPTGVSAAAQNVNESLRRDHADRRANVMPRKLGVFAAGEDLKPSTVVVGGETLVVATVVTRRGPPSRWRASEDTSLPLALWASGRLVDQTGIEPVTS